MNALEKYAAKKQLIEKLSGVQRVARIRASINRKSLPNPELNPKGYWNAPQDLKLALRRAEDKIERRLINKEMQLQMGEANMDGMPWQIRLIDKLDSLGKKLPEIPDRRGFFRMPGRSRMDRERVGPLAEKRMAELLAAIDSRNTHKLSGK